MVKATERTELRGMLIATEIGQGWYRLTVATMILAGLAVARFWPVVPGLDELTALIACYIVYAGLWLVVVARALLHGRIRRIATVVIDQLTFGLGLYLGGAYAAALVCMPVSIAIGNGLRYGRRYTWLAVWLGAGSCAAGVVASPYWRSLPAVSAGIVLSIVLIPLYASALNARMAEAKRRLERRAARFELACMTDSVTGILNRYGFLNALSERNARAGQSPGALMLLDLDGFKAINDACGHAAGDMVLMDTATRLARCFRASDRVARIGGDEFAVLLSDVNSQALVEQLAEMALATIADIRVDHHPPLTLSASIGICMLPHPQVLGVDAMLHLADSLMYQAKKSGKNCFRISTTQQAADTLAT
jgi:diguanylate cyclase (GGDEF)-like protein